MLDSDDMDPDEYDPFRGASKREPDELDRSLEPILVELCKAVGFQIRDQTPALPVVVSIDVGYSVQGDTAGTDRHVRIIFNMPEDFEEKYMKYATERLIKDAKNIISGNDEESSDPK